MLLQKICHRSPRAAKDIRFDWDLYECPDRSGTRLIQDPNSTGSP